MTTTAHAAVMAAASVAKARAIGVRAAVSTAYALTRDSIARGARAAAAAIVPTPAAQPGLQSHGVGRYASTDGRVHVVCVPGGGRYPWRVRVRNARGRVRTQRYAAEPAALSAARLAIVMAD